MLKYVDVSALRSLMQGLTFDVENCAGVLDHALVGLNARNGFPDRMCDWVRAGGLAAGPGPFVSQKRTIIRLTETLNQAGQSTYMALVLSAREAESAPLVSLVMHSPTLDVPMVVQLPLRAVLKGSPSLEGAYTVPAYPPDRSRRGLALLRDHTSGLEPAFPRTHPSRRSAQIEAFAGQDAR